MKQAKIKRIINFYGEEAQKDVAVEEMAELTKELMKERRGVYNKDAILEEIADVTLMLHQLLIIYNFTKEDVNRIIDEKVERQIKRVKEDEWVKSQPMWQITKDRREE